MDTVLIAGVESIVGANLAASLSECNSVVGLSFGSPVSIDGCSTSVCPAQEQSVIRNWVATVRPNWIVYCGPAARSTWQHPQTAVLDSKAVDAAKYWSAAAACPSK